MSQLPGWLQELIPILGLLIVVILIVRRLPRVDVGHSPEFIARVKAEISSRAVELRAAGSVS